MKSAIVLLFSLTSFLAAILLFTVEPMIGKMVLPIWGGTPAVWNTCLVYFQMMLLCGYLFAHGVNSREGLERHRVSLWYLLPFVVLLAIGYSMQPIRLGADLTPRWPTFASAGPAWALLGVLSASATLPLLTASATAPLVQHWFTLTGHPRSRDPYFLYAASNAGSLLGLLAYPFAIEPNLSLAAQGRAWKAGYLLLALLLMSCGVIARRLSRWTGPPEADGGSGGVEAILGEEASSSGPRIRPTPGTWLRWLILVFVPSSWLMGVTTYLTTDLAAMPLLWVIPLSLYLLSFILAFSRAGSGTTGLALRVLPIAVVPLVLVMIAGFPHAIWIPLHLLAFFVGSVACHGALARIRPATQHLSAFYVTIALGGLLGGVFNTLIAPVVFDRVVEYPLASVLACLVAPGFGAGEGLRGLKGWLGDLILPAIVLLLAAILTTNQAGLADSVLGAVGIMIASGLGIFACATARRRPMRFAMVVGAVLAAGGLSQGPSGRLLHIERGFFGVLRVTEDSTLRVHRLFHGSTLHGEQSLDPALAREPRTYFSRGGPIGQVFESLRPRLDQPGARVAIIGLGAGTLASYARPGQRWTFYEIDPSVERIARDPRFFTYVRDCEADSVDVVLGDARLRLRDAPDHAYRLIVIDVFSSDSLPVHIFTSEAIGLYRSRLAEGGVLAFNLSNRYLDLAPVMARQAADAGLICRIRSDKTLSDEEKRAGKQPSVWAVMAASEGALLGLADDPRWQCPVPRPGSSPWTDDYSDVASYSRWIPRAWWQGVWK